MFLQNTAATKNSNGSKGAYKPDMKGHNLVLIKVFGTVTIRLQLKCFKMVLLPKAAHWICRHPGTGQTAARAASHTLHKHPCQPEEKTSEGGKQHEEGKPFFWEQCGMKILNRTTSESGNYYSKTTQRKDYNTYQKDTWYSLSFIF